MTHAEAFCSLVARRTGLCFRLDTRGYRSLERFVSARVKTLGLRESAEYLQLLDREGIEGEEFARLIAAISNTQTWFFRDEDQLTALCRVLTEQCEAAGGPLNIWSAGCSTGQEPYSIAMLCTLQDLDVRILATDINQEAVEFAKAARYPSWTLDKLPSSYRQRYVTEHEHEAEICPQVKERVELRLVNLVEDACPRPGGGHVDHWDAILCRNVFIYFEPATVQHVATKFSSVMRHESVLFLGAAESLHNLSVPLSPRRIGEAFAYHLRTRQNGIDGSADPAREQPRFAHDLAALAAINEARALARKALDQGGSHRRRAELAGRPTVRTLRARASRSTVTAPTKLAKPHDGYQHALTLIDRGQLMAARTALQALVAQQPALIAAHLTLGNVFLRLSDFAEALKAYDEALKHNPINPEAHYFQGVVHRKLGDLAAAERAFRRALFLQPDFWCAAYLLAGIHLRLGKQELYRRDLAHTLECLKQAKGELFISHTRDVEMAEISKEAVARMCRQRLGEAKDSQHPSGAS